MLRKFFLLLVLLISGLQIQAQKVEIEPTISPEFFAANESITITYDVTGTIMHDWTEAWLWMWVPSSSGANVTSNINPANANSALTDAARFTKTVDAGRQLFSIVLTPTDFTQLPKEEIQQLGMLIKGNDWSNGQSIDYVAEVGNEFRVLFENPEGDFAFYETGEIIDIHLRAAQLADLEVWIDNVTLATAPQAEELFTEHTVIPDGNIHTLMGVGTTTSGDTDTVIYQYTVPPTPPMVALPAGVKEGINYPADQTSATLVLLAPEKKNVFVIGDFNDWSLDNDYLMNQDGDHFWITLTDLVPGQEYRFQYLVDGIIRVADPYSEKITSPFDDPEIILENRYPGLLPYPSGETTEGIGFLQTNKTPFEWSNESYVRPAKEDLVIYELLIRDFTDERTFNAVTERLDYLQGLGVNAIELMPVMEFEGNISWGYNPAFMFAVDKYYGTEEELKTLINEAHNRGMAVILDIVLNHAFGRCPLVRLYNDDLYGPPTLDNPWLNRDAKHDFNVGYDFNHESIYTQEYVDRVNRYWIEEYKIDGFRFDLSKGFTQKNTLGDVGAWGAYDASRVALLKRMADKIWEVDPDNYIILEHFADNSEESELSDYGMMLWASLHRAYISAAKGNPSNFRDLFFKDRGFEDPHAIGYMESHDEERTLFEALETNSADLDFLLEKLKLNAAFFFLVPGPKMIWQFGEMGYDEELNNDRLGIKPTHWEYLDDPQRKKLFDVYTSLINLKTKTEYLDPEYFSWTPNGFFKWINIDHPDVKIAAFGNFRNDLELEEEIPFPAAGTWYNYFSGETIEVEDPTAFSMKLEPGELRLYTSTPIDNYISSNPLPDRNNFTGDSDLLQVFPSPVTDFTTVQYPTGTQEVLVYDMAGRLIQAFETDNNSPQIEIDFSGWPLGGYMISITAASGTQAVKFIKL